MAGARLAADAGPRSLAPTGPEHVHGHPADAGRIITDRPDEVKAVSGNVSDIAESDTVEFPDDGRRHQTATVLAT